MIDQPEFNFAPDAELVTAVGRDGAVEGANPSGAPQEFDLATVSAEVSHSEVAVAVEPTSLRREPPMTVASAPFRLVPHAVFMSWSPESQRAYCAARDRDSATTAHERGEDPDFYTKRAATYGL